MQVEDVKSLVTEAIPECELDVTIEGSHVHLTVVSEAFEGLNPVKKQQLVYGALQQSIASGDIHAVHMKTYTPAQWQQLEK